jgi:hypothetical protein
MIFSLPWITALFNSMYRSQVQLGMARTESSAKVVFVTTEATFK